MRKQTVFDHLSVDSYGNVNIRFAKQVIDDDGAVISNQWVRTSMFPGQDTEQHLSVITAAVDGFAAPDDKEYDIIRSVKALVDTPEKVADYETKVRSKSPLDAVKGGK